MSRPLAEKGRTMRNHFLLALLFAATTVAPGCQPSASGLGAAEPVAATSEYLRTTCADGPVTRGIDVSKWQGTINWDQVSGSGVRFAFIRVSDGARYRDSFFSRNWTEARRVGIHRGAYQFFRPAQSVRDQANLMIEALRADGGELAPVIDVESTDGRSRTQVQAAVREWIDLVSAATGRTPIIYTGPYFWRDSVGNPDMSGNPLWIAHYGPRCPLISEDVWSRWSFWQYTDRGRVPGISGNVDMNYFNGTLADLEGMPMPPPPPPMGSGELSSPIDPMNVSSNVSHTSGGRGVRYDCSAFPRANHKGTDFAVPRRTPVHAAAAGTVVRAVDGCSEGASSCGGSFGNHVIILHENGRATLYAHMTSGTVSVRRDERVTCGQEIGLSGNTGHSTGPHLHFEVRDGVRGTGDGAVASYYSRPPTDPYGGSCSSQPTDLWGSSCMDTAVRDDSELESATHARTVTVAPGEELTQNWVLRNSGTTTWTTMEDYRLTHVSGPRLDGLANVGLESSVMPRATSRFSVTVRAPMEGGTYVSVYRMTHGDMQFGVTVRINLRVALPRACNSMTLGRSVPSGSCVQVTYPACGMSTCAWFRCADGAWQCTEASACAGESFAQDACAPPVDCGALACGDCTGTRGCTWCEADSACVPVAADGENTCSGTTTNDPMACMACYEVGFACAADNQCCGWTAGGNIECMDGFCEDTNLCGANGDTCVEGDPMSRCCGLQICSADTGGTLECCTRAGERCTTSTDCCGFMACGADGFCAPQAVGAPCRSSQECEGASFCTDANVCGF